MNLVTGNAHDIDTQGTGWFLGFSPWTLFDQGDLLHVPRQQPLTGLCIKWYAHPDGHDSGPAKPISEGRTISILVSEGSSFRLEFCTTPEFEPTRTRTIVLKRHGDFAAWGPDLFHRWHCEVQATVMTVRWVPQAA